MKNKWMFLLLILLIFSCYSRENKTEERGTQRVTEFIQLALTDHWEEAEAYLSRSMADSENKEVLLQNFDTWQLKDTSKVDIVIEGVFIAENDPKERALVSFQIINVETNFTKIASMPIRYERGDWYIGQ
jgi:hypothetical protein